MVSGFHPVSKKDLETKLGEMNRLSPLFRVADVCNDFMTDDERGGLAVIVHKHRNVPFTKETQDSTAFQLLNWALLDLLPEALKANDEDHGKIETLPVVDSDSADYVFSQVREFCLTPNQERSVTYATLKSVKDAAWYMTMKKDLPEAPGLTAAAVGDAVESAVTIMPREKVIGSLLKTLRNLR